MKRKIKKINYIDGSRLKRAIIAGSQLIFHNKERLNEINVFPVPDGDTGTNMAVTMNKVNEDLKESSERSVSVVSRDLADAALRGAQGNSGAILAQFFQGFSEAVGDKFKLTTKHFAEAVQHAKESARQAMSEPREGTILTVISDWANAVEKFAHKTDDFIELLKNSLVKAKEALKETPHKLEVLRKAGVVDAGAEGFVNLLEGIIHFIEKGKIKNAFNTENYLSASTTALKEFPEDIKYRYCTECIFETINGDRKKLQATLADFGDSIVIVGGPNKFRIHMHSNFPKKVFKMLATLGVVSNKKIDDMKKQHKFAFKKQKTKPIGIVVDSSCDLPEDYLLDNDVHMIPVRLTFGEQIFRDKFDISVDEFYQKLTESPFHPTTSQPAYQDIKEVLDEIYSKYENIIAILLPRVLSGTYQAVLNVANQYEKNKFFFFDSKKVSAGTGIIVMEAIDAIKQGLPLEKVIDRIQHAIEHTHLFFSVATLKFLVKGGRISASKGLIGNLLKLSPIISFDETGKLVPVAKGFGQESSLKKIVKMISEEAKAYKSHRFLVAHANAPEKANWFAEQVKLHFQPDKPIIVLPIAPVLGVHAGPGTAGLGFLGKN